LCPTTWIRENLKDQIEDSKEFISPGAGEEETVQTELWQELPSWFQHPLPPEPTYEKPIADLLTVIEEVLRKAGSLGRVVILTNAITGWVSNSAKRWLSTRQLSLRQLFNDLNIDVKYARDYPVRPPWITPSNRQGLPGLPWQPPRNQFYGSDEEEKKQSARDWMFTEMKAKAMADIISSASHTNYKNLVSIGDSHFEISAMESASRRYHRTTSKKRSFSAGDGVSLHVEPVGNEAQSAHRHGYGCIKPKRCYQKTIKMLYSPLIEDMIAQLRTIRDCLPRLVAAAADFTCSTERDPFDMGRLGAAPTAV
jgi:hypothetical protein